MQKFCNILLPLLVFSNMVYFYFFSVNNPAELPFNGGDTYYVDGLRLRTEGGGLDTTFTNQKDFAKFLDEHSAKTYHEALKWEIDRVISDYSSVLVMHTGEIYINYCYPYDEEICFDLILNGKECDDYKSCLYFNEE